jgi:glycosyltransferase involved in cell wall biosynthesis
VTKTRVVIFIEYYLPGFRAGGPMRSVSALVDHLGGQIDFFILTRDRDEGDLSPYPDSLEGVWRSVGRAKIRYLAPHEITVRRLGAAVREVQPDVVYLNGFFGELSMKPLMLRRLGRLEGIHVVLAPRGELSPGALRLKAFKKRIFLRLSQVIGLHRSVIFHASTARESEEISVAIPQHELPRIARNPVAATGSPPRACAKVSGAARFVFVSRIARKKNLHVAIDLLRSLKGSVEFDIYGPVIDEMYWRECRALISSMPPNVKVTYHGPIRHDLVAATLSGHHFFLFPTASENFGHAIVEALLAGCPVITSDQTPWLGLTSIGVGWDLPLEHTARWQQVLQRCVDMDASTFETASRTSQSFGLRIAAEDTTAENLQLFRTIVEPVGGDRSPQSRQRSEDRLPFRPPSAS